MLSIKDLEDKRLERASRNHELYRSFFIDIITKIKYRDILGHRNIVHRIPGIVVGFPLYDVNHAIQYVIHKLNQGGFFVFPWKDNYIYVDWSIGTIKDNKDKKTERHKEKNKEPITNDDIDDMIRKINQD
jgi:hypothetical protein